MMKKGLLQKALWGLVFGGSLSSYAAALPLEWPAETMVTAAKGKASTATSSSKAGAKRTTKRSARKGSVETLATDADKEVEVIDINVEPSIPENEDLRNPAAQEVAVPLPTKNPALAPSSTANSGAFSGLSVGLGIGYVGGTLNVQGTATALPKVDFAQQTLTSYGAVVTSRNPMPGFLGNIQIAYMGSLPDCWTLGMAGGGALTTTRARPSFVAVGVKPPAVGAELVSTKVSDKGHFNLMTRWGRQIGQTMPFINAGWSIHRLTLMSPQMAGAMAKWVNCFLVGLGIDVKLSSHTVIGVVANVHLGGKGRFNFNQLDTGIPMAYTVRPVLPEFFATVKYLFPGARLKSLWSTVPKP